VSDRKREGESGRRGEGEKEYTMVREREL